MSILVVFDSSLKIDSVRFPAGGEKEIFLFPLTSSDELVSRVAEKAGTCGCRISEILRTARLINETAERIRGKYLDFIAGLPESGDLKEIFSVDGKTSLWWFGLIAEKNTFKTDSFQRLAQMEAIFGVLGEKNIREIYFGCRSGKLKNTLSDYAKTAHIGFRTLPVTPFETLQERIARSRRFLYLKHLLHLLHFSWTFFLRVRKIRRRVGGLNRGRPKENGLTLVTYFPNYDAEAATRGVYRDKYYPALQEALSAGGTDISWLAMCVANNAVSFSESLQHARRFIESGEKIRFLEEFLRFADILHGLGFMLRTGLKFRKFEKTTIAPRHSFGTYNFYGIFRDDWHSSFVGCTGLTGLLYYAGFKSFLSGLEVEKVLYLCEMHAWEKALISARNAAQKKTKLFAYQHATVPWMLLNYFNSRAEVEDRSPFPLPKPDMIICNGDLTRQYMRDCGWPEAGLSVAEALRFSHLKKCARGPARDEKVVLVVLSIDPGSSTALLRMCREAVKGMEGVEVWVKPHPFLNMKSISRLLAEDVRHGRLKIRTEPVTKLLEKVRVIVIDESSVAIEGLAFGCAVIMVNLSESINMSPLKNIAGDMIRQANSSGELRSMVEFMLQANASESEKWRDSADRIVNHFFCLRRDSDTPERFLHILEGETGTVHPRDGSAGAYQQHLKESK